MTTTAIGFDYLYETAERQGQSLGAVLNIGEAQAVAVATTSLVPGGGIISTIYVIDGTRLISVTAGTENERDKVALGSLKLLQ